jgi:tetratricopeptide (TPR) repeat protein
VAETKLPAVPADAPFASAEARGLAEAARERANVHVAKGEFSTALTLFDEALAFARQAADAPFADWIYVCRAGVAAEVSAADAELMELKKILLRAREPGTAFRAAYTAARIYELRRDYPRAATYNARARDYADSLGDTFFLASCDNQLGNVFVADSRFEEAAAAHRRALESVAKTGAVTPVVREIWRDNLGYDLIGADRVPEGLGLVHEALEFFETNGARGYALTPLADLCFGYLKLDRYAEARFFGEAALERLDEEGTPDTSLEKNLLYLLGETCHLSGDPGSAKGYFDRLARFYPEFRNLRAYLEVFDFRNVINLRGTP